MVIHLIPSRFKGAIAKRIAPVKWCRDVIKYPGNAAADYALADPPCYLAQETGRTVMGGSE
jgi:hypothetical protein